MFVGDRGISIYSKNYKDSIQNPDFYTKENLRIRLPEIEYKKAMNTFIDIYDDLYSSDITNIEFIDLRIPEKMIIKFYNENN